jgi:prepilin-type N-terminal cleavage/methylation domain-containing protein
MQQADQTAERGFTLIELSIVLVIIGLIVGGVLVGKSLIDAAAVRATISQIERYNTAANTFRDKYGGLPGDLNAQAASQFGFLSRPGSSGQGDGNGIIQGMFSNGGPEGCGMIESIGEAPSFWVDLSSAHLIEGTFSTAQEYNNLASTVTLTTTPSVASFFPQAKLGQGNFIYVYSGGVFGGGTIWNATGINYYGISAVSAITMSDNGKLVTTPGLTVGQAAAMDSKIDDGFPQSGRVAAQHLTENCCSAPTWVGPSDTSATAGSSATCYDNGGVNGAKQQYSVEISGGSNVNCALSFQMQAGD